MNKKDLEEKKEKDKLYLVLFVIAFIVVFCVGMALDVFAGFDEPVKEKIIKEQDLKDFVEYKKVYDKKLDKVVLDKTKSSKFKFLKDKTTEKKSLNHYILSVQDKDTNKIYTMIINKKELQK